MKLCNLRWNGAKHKASYVWANFARSLLQKSETNFENSQLICNRRNLFKSFTSQLPCSHNAIWHQHSILRGTIALSSFKVYLCIVYIALFFITMIFAKGMSKNYLINYIVRNRDIRETFDITDIWFIIYNYIWVTYEILFKEKERKNLFHILFIYFILVYNINIYLLREDLLFLKK